MIFGAFHSEIVMKIRSEEKGKNVLTILPGDRAYMGKEFQLYLGQSAVGENNVYIGLARC